MVVSLSHPTSGLTFLSVGESAVQLSPTSDVCMSVVVRMCVWVSATVNPSSHTGTVKGFPHAKDIDDVITVSPFPGDFDICPEEDRHHNMKHFFHVANMELQFNMHNWWRIKQCLISPSMSELRDIQREGYRDTLRFLKARGEWTTHMPFQTHTCIRVHTHHFTCTHHTHTHLYTRVP